MWQLQLLVATAKNEKNRQVIKNWKRKRLGNKIKENVRPILCFVPTMTTGQVPTEMHVKIVKHIQQDIALKGLPSDVHEISSSGKTELMWQKRSYIWVCNARMTATFDSNLIKEVEPVLPFEKKAFCELYRVLPTFKLCIQCMWKLRSLKLVPIQTSIEPKSKGAPRIPFIRHTYLHEEHSMGQTAVWLSSNYSKSFWRMTCFLLKKANLSKWLPSIGTFIAFVGLLKKIYILCCFSVSRTWMSPVMQIMW